MAQREEHWFGENDEHIVIYVKETGSDVEPTGIVEVSYELWSEVLETLGFQKELLAVDIPEQG